VTAVTDVDRLKSKIRDVPDWPEEGIVFKDIMPLLADAEALRKTIDVLSDWAAERKPDIVVGGEARGFFIGSAIAYKLGCGFVPARRPGKLPLETISAEYALEYGRNTLELQADAFEAERERSSTTTSSRPEGPRRRWPTSSSSWAERSSEWPFSSSSTS